MNEKRKIRGGTIWLAAALMAGFLSGCLGCGGQSYLHVGLERNGSLERPVWVGVYFVNSETALDGKENAELTNKDNAKNLGSADGVVGAPSIQPVYPGREPITIPMDNYDPAITNILIVANYPNPSACTRLKVPVKKGDNLKLKIEVGEECLSIVQGKK